MWSVRKKGKSRKKRQQQALLKRSEILFGSFVLLRRQVTAIFFSSPHQLFCSSVAVFLLCCWRKSNKPTIAVEFCSWSYRWRERSRWKCSKFIIRLEEKEKCSVLSFHTIWLAVPKEIIVSIHFSHSAIGSFLNTFKFQHHHHHPSPSNRTFMFDWIALRLFLSPANNNNNIIELKMKSQPRTDGRARNCSLRYFLNQPGGFNM